MIENDCYQSPKSLSDQVLENISKEELIQKWKQLDKYRLNLEERERKNLAELTKLKNIILMNYVSSKEIELGSQFQESQSSPFSHINVSNTQQQHINKLNSFLDPCISSIIIQLRKDLDDTKKKRDELQMELNATKFTPENQLTKRLIAKCRKLISENQELGRIISSGNVAQLEHDLAYHKQLLNEACQNEQSINSFLFEVDNEMEKMQLVLIKLKEDKISDDTKNKEKEGSEKKSKKKKTK